MRRIPDLTAKQKARFWKTVYIPKDRDACWLWLAYKDLGGYGSVGWRIDGKTMTYLAHRVAYYLSTGVQPDKFCCHTCDNPTCVNPAHIFLGTYLDNARDRDKKGRSGAHKRRGKNNGRYTKPERTCRGERWHQVHDIEEAKARMHKGFALYMIANPSWLKGEKNPRAKLTEKDVRYIRQVHDPQTMSSRKLGKIYGVSKTTINSIINHKLWPHVA